ncbi:MAG: MBL fold metallo-hydrolase, partial [Deltaproteobacteria bacterium]|nr:MBL fold metallo-hydrolase [Deltaproteobacteria bacterium]
MVLLAVLAACPSSRPSKPTTPITQGGSPRPGAPQLSWKKIETAADLPPAPAPGTYQIHMIDVGTGLAILVRGADFTMLYDAGTNDREEKPMRVAAYLAAALGPSGDDLCGAPAEPRLQIDHVVLSHPHLDHASALDLVMHCYHVPDFWDSGRINETVFYRELLSKLSQSTTRYHTAAEVPTDRTLSVKGLGVTMPHWERFSEGDKIRLGEGAQFTILHANAKGGSDMNQSSVVLAVELGGIRLLLVGDAESGPRQDPSYPPGDVEEFLINAHTERIRSDILQVGHHGSKTSSRRAFLEVVKPRLALVSSGPKRYGKTTLPDREV